jgi:hypothetical protein
MVFGNINGPIRYKWAYINCIVAHAKIQDLEPSPLIEANIMVVPWCLETLTGLFVTSGLTSIV